MRKRLYLVIAAVLGVILLAVFIRSSSDNNYKDTAAVENSTRESTAMPTEKPDPIPATQEDTGTGQDTETAAGTEEEIDTDGEVLKSLSEDLDNDNENEKIEVLQINNGQSSDKNNAGPEGKLRIKGKDGVREISFVKKSDSLTGILSDLTIADLDGDGAKDIFIIIPGVGNPFTLNYFYMYSYKEDKQFSFNINNSLTTFTKGFKFNYKGEGLLEIKNDKYGFIGTINLHDNPGFSVEDESNSQYNRSWVEPVPSEIGDDSKLKLIDAADGTVEIKLPLPIFGVATADVLGEVDLFYTVNKDFNAEMKRFEVVSFSGNTKTKIGEGKIAG